FLLCHDCWCWVEPVDERCPHCRHTIDPVLPDPDLATLGALIGPLVTPIGEVRVRRRMLPEYGMLYETGGGLFFVPHRSEHLTQMVEASGAGSLAWTLASVVWAPLMFLLPFVRSKELQESRIRVLRPQEIDSADGPGLPELLMENPGAFFIPRRSIRRLQRRGRRWIIGRAEATSVRLRAEGDRRTFHERMCGLLEADRWQMAAAGY
ncbi:MAG: hypothetical protein KY476_27210, partial [Planctomycetes bacterium]|nr:hypothetical protein [Planctomycetota bacterium]